MTTITQFDTLPQCAKTRRGLVAVAMSGGVDSSAVAALLQQQGCTVVGLTMQLWNQRRLPELQGAGPARHRCCSLDDVYDAKAVAQHLNFPHYVVNFEEHFEDRVVRPFVDQYLTGRTPIACTNCNTDVKFEPLLRMARQIGAERLATGHYARIRKNAGSGRSELLRARDETKDQSYFLWGLSEEQLSRSDFPLGELTKEEVRALARRANLPVAEKPESMELCFVPNGNYVQFIQAYSQERGISLQNGEGEIVSESGELIGRHHGVQNFTIGQRKGLGFAAGKPLYVLSIDPHSMRSRRRELDFLREARRLDSRLRQNPPQARARGSHYRAAGCLQRACRLRHAATRHHPRPGRRILRRRHCPRRRLDPLNNTFFVSRP